MAPITFRIPQIVKSVLIDLTISLSGLLVTRFLFLISNYTRFPNLSVIDFLYGIWIDLITVGLFFFPYYTLYLLPIPIHGYQWHRLLFKISFHIINSFLIFVNLIDIVYFSFPMKRSTFDLFRHLLFDIDLGALSNNFFLDFWWLFLSFFLLIFVSIKAYNKVERPKTKIHDFSVSWLKKRSLAFLLLTLALFLIARGGTRPKPIGPLDALIFASSPNNVEFILNTPFSILKTIAVTSVEPPKYYSEKEVKHHFNPIKRSTPQSILPDNTNLVIIVLESFGMEYVGHLNKTSKSTPFLDSILKQSLSFEYVFANGKTSIDAIPAIVSSIPSLMNDPYLSTSYANNKIESIPKSLSKKGYKSAFFHGATNGSMRFDSFAKHAGFDYYFGRNEYNNDDHYDGTWGIFDHHFNQWAAQKMSSLKEPFFSLLFTISSHHPYTLPNDYLKQFPEAKFDIQHSIEYGDYALAKFFKKAEKQPWFKNTLFIITADHSPSTKSPLYNKRSHMYRIPLAFYHPKIDLRNYPVNKKITQQIDIFPTVLDLFNINETFYSLGSSIYSKDNFGVLNYSRGSYFYFKKNHMLTIYNEKAQNLINFTFNEVEQTDSLSEFPLEIVKYEKEIKSLIQTFYSDLQQNVIWTE